MTFALPSTHLVADGEGMKELGASLASELRVGDVVILRGPLGAGKTTFTQGIGSALGISDISSPTFVISRVHKSDPQLVHVDAYRLLGSGDSAIQFDDLDLETSRENSITVIEWGSELAHRFAESYLLVDIAFVDELDPSNQMRKVVIEKR
ncbi:MAG: tRNA (adenosine(37)-N6)-threonylcarbamoyltransferase complex ATPase subunit type 1 TsaE [Candidatus Nanopelagicaceae bacterium]